MSNNKIVAVQIPNALQAHADGHSEVLIAGETVSAVLENLVTAYPDLEDRLFKKEEPRALNRFLNVFLTEEQCKSQPAHDQLRLSDHVSSHRLHNHAHVHK